MRAPGSILAVSLLACASLAFAQPGEEHGMARQHPNSRQDLKEQLKLTDKQKADMLKLRTAMEKAIVEIQSKIKIARIDLRSMFAAESPDRSAIESKMKDISDLRYQARKMAVDHLFDVYAMLTPEQQKIWKDRMMHHNISLLHPMMKGHRGWNGMRHPDGRPGGMQEGMQEGSQEDMED